MYALLTCKRIVPTPAPFFLHSSGKKRVHLSQNHLERAKFLAYSNSQKGLFFVQCVLFWKSLCSGYKHGGHHKPNHFVRSPCVHYSRLFCAEGCVTKHMKNEYHLFALGAAQAFLARIKFPEKGDIQNLFDTNRSKQANENRLILKSIVDVILLLGRQNIPLRGHREQFFDSNPYNNRGNFLALLNFSISKGDKTLEKHLNVGAKNAKYTSPKVQNMLIDACGKIITKK